MSAQPPEEPVRNYTTSTVTWVTISDSTGYESFDEVDKGFNKAFQDKLKAFEMKH